MYTIDDLADELNRQEWAVERMLKNRGYLKQNGDPRRSTINDGLMDEDGMITDGGWSTFIDELGYKDSSNDEDDEDDDGFDFEEDEDDDENDDLDFMEDDEDNEEETDSEDENDDVELPKISSKYHNWKISVVKDPDHKYVIAADLHAIYKDEFDNLIDDGVIKEIEINGDEIDEGTDVESYVIDKIDECEEELADKKNWRKNYGKYMGLDEDSD